MSENRPYCLSIAGYDPCGGAGVLADIKTFEQIRVQGLAVATAVTWQNDSRFDGLRWLSAEELFKQLEPLREYPVKAVKIGLIQDIDCLKELLSWLKASYPLAKIVWDPVLKATAGFAFHDYTTIEMGIRAMVDLITPNLFEYEKLFGQDDKSFDRAVLIKGGHGGNNPGSDILVENGLETIIEGELFADKVDKHGTGCVLSSAITAALAKGHTLKEACSIGKNYVEKFIKSNSGNLGYHKL